MTDYIKNILQIKDPNLHFTDVVFENNDGRETQVFIGTVSLKLDRCPHCGFANTFIKNGHSYQTVLSPVKLTLIKTKTQFFLSDQIVVIFRHGLVISFSGNELIREVHYSSTNLFL